MIPKVTDTRIDKPASAPIDAANKNADTTTQPQSPITGRLGTKEVTQLVSSTTDQPQQLSSTEKAEATDAPNNPKPLEARTVGIMDQKADNTSDAPKTDTNAAIPNVAIDSVTPGTHAPQVTSEKPVAPAACAPDFETEVDSKTAQKYLLALYADYKHKEAYDQFIGKNGFSGVEALLDRCIKNGFDINHKNKSGQTFLHVATEWKDLKLVKILLSRKANPNCKTVKKNTPLQVASASNHIEIMKLLVAAGANVNTQNDTYCTPLIRATECGNLDAILLLLNAGSDIDDSEDSSNCSALHVAAHAGYLEIVKLLIERKAQINSLRIGNVTPLHLAAEQGHTNIVKFLIQNNANINAFDLNGHSVLFMSALKGHESVVDALIMAGADIYIKSKKGITALMAAATNGHATIVKKLSNAGVPIEDAEDVLRRRALHYAVLSGHFEIVTLLVDEGAQINAVISTGATALVMAATRGQTDIVKFLIQKGADVNLMDNKGNTPLVYAMSHGHAEISAFLIHNGATL